MEVIEGSCEKVFQMKTLIMLSNFLIARKLQKHIVIVKNDKLKVEQTILDSNAGKQLSQAATDVLLTLVLKKMNNI